MSLDQIGERARAACRALAGASTAAKNAALAASAQALEQCLPQLLEANERDVAAARAAERDPAFIDRLTLNEKRVREMAGALRKVASLPDPVGEIVNMRNRPSGIRVGQMRSPIGTLAIVYESRPNVTADAAALCLKSGNACILRGGSEAIHSNLEIARILTREFARAGMPEGALQIVETTDRAAVGELLRMDRHIDAVIPRGGKSLIERVAAEATMPVIKHLDGNCTVYVDESADHDMATKIVINAKTQRPGVCNAAETLLVHRAEADRFLPRVAAELLAAGVELRGCERTRAIVPQAVPATEEDWYAEYLALILAVRVVDSLEQAIDFINRYGSHHTEAIVTDSWARAQRFLREIDSACIHVNCSTRFSDGGEYGLGAEIGISTNKLHARGPMGLNELTTLKWIVFGRGEVRT